jgi:hypothetical protein
MKQKSYIYVIVIVIVLMIITYLYNLSDNLSKVVTTIKLESLVSKNPTIKVIFKNPTSSAIELKQPLLTIVDSNQAVVLTSKLEDKTYMIKAFGETIVDIPLKLSIEDALKTIKSFGNGLKAIIQYSYGWNGWFSGKIEKDIRV